jgi:surface carbohydrate biosynthesis protein
MIQKLSRIIGFFSKVKIIFKNPTHSQIVVIDGESKNEIKNILSDLDWTVVETRNHLIKKIYITPGIIFNFLLNLRGNIKIAYLTALIQKIKPKIAITYIDNSFHFSDIAKNFRGKIINFIAIQNAWRGDVSEYDYFFQKGLIRKNPNKNLYIPTFFCLGQNDIKKYKRYKINVNKFYKVGSLKLYDALKCNQKKNGKKYDICLISNTTWQRTLTSCEPSFVLGYVKLVSYCIKFIREKKLKLIFCLKSSTRSVAIQNYEISIFKKYLSNDDFKFLKKNSTYKNKEKYLSYKNAFNSKVVVGLTSTILGECLSYGKKVFVCNYSNLEYCDFPVKGICFSKKINYDHFSKRLLQILSCTNIYYYKKLRQKKNFIVNYDSKVNPNTVIKSYIENILKKDH